MKILVTQYAQVVSIIGFAKSSKTFQYKGRNAALTILGDMRQELNDFEEKYGADSREYKALGKRFNKNVKAYEKKFNTTLEYNKRGFGRYSDSKNKNPDNESSSEN